MAQRFVRANVKPRDRRRRRVRARVVGTSERPRLSVFRSGQHMTAQLINDAVGATIVAASDSESGISPPKADPPRAENQESGIANQRTGTTGEGRKVAVAYAIGRLIAERAKAKGITAAVFDRGGYAYHGRVRAVAEGAREGGLEF